MKYDIESFLSDLEAFLKANVNTQITALNTEKNDSIVLAPIVDDAYFVQSMNEAVANYNPFIFYGVDTVDSQANGPQVRKAYSVDVIVVLVDSASDLKMAKRLFRYSRVLEDLFKNNWQAVGRAVKLDVQSLVPVAFTLQNSSEAFRAVGVTLDFTLV